MSLRALGQHAHFYDCVEHLAVQQLISQAGVEALKIAFLPGTVILDAGSGRVDACDLNLHRRSAELWPLVGADECWGADLGEQTALAPLGTS